jgi:Putative beta barrel porin-7 (BBP7)
MRNGLLGSILLLLLAILPATANGQSPATSENSGPPRAVLLFDPSPSPSPSPLDPDPSTFTPPCSPLAPHPSPLVDDRPNCSPPGYRYYGDVDYILWWSERDHRDDFGALIRNGIRGTLGLWLNPQQNYGMEVGGFWVADRSPGDDSLAGTVNVSTRFHSNLWDAEAQLRAEIYRGTWAHLDALAGFSYLRLDEALDVGEHEADVGTLDRIGTRNNFYGGQLGAELHIHYNKFFLDLWGKAALGVNDETIEINAVTIADGQTFAGGSVAAPAFIGNHHRDQFAVVPQFGINLGFECGQHLRFSAGYTFLYLTDAARPGAQIDALLGTPSSSPFPFQSGEFWIQGLNLGLEFRF